MNIKDIKNTEEIKPVTTGYCVYFLTNENGDIVYIGKSNMKTLSRISEHKKNKEFKKAFLIDVKSKEEMDEKEKELIFQIRPKYNREVLKPNYIIEELSKEFISQKEIRKLIPYGISPLIIRKVSSVFNVEEKQIIKEKFYNKKILIYLVQYIKELKDCPLSLNYQIYDKIKKGEIETF